MPITLQCKVICIRLLNCRSVARYRSSASISPSDSLRQDKTFIDADVNHRLWSEWTHHVSVTPWRAAAFARLSCIGGRDGAPRIFRQRPPFSENNDVSEMP